VDEVVLDQVDYNRATADSLSVPKVGLDEFVFTDYTGSEAINGVTLRAYAKVNYVNNGYGKIRFHCNIGGTKYYSDLYVLPGTTTLHSHTWALSPATSAAWTKTEINAAIFGYTLLVVGIYNTTPYYKGDDPPPVDFVIAMVYQFNVLLDESVPAMEATADFGQPDLLVTGDIVLEPLAMVAVADFGEPIVSSVTILTATMEATADFGTPILASISSHGVRDAVYWGDGRRPNCIIVMGKETATGNLVFGYAEDGVESERDPLLYWYSNAYINSFALAQAVATNLLSKLRLETPRGEMVIFPNLAQEQWDVIHTADSVNGVDGNYRVSGLSLRYDRQASEFVQTLKLTNV
jgi:hypothetical protein